MDAEHQSPLQQHAYESAPTLTAAASTPEYDQHPNIMDMEDGHVPSPNFPPVSNQARGILSPARNHVDASSWSTTSNQQTHVPPHETAEPFWWGHEEVLVPYELPDAPPGSPEAPDFVLDEHQEPVQMHPSHELLLGGGSTSSNSFETESMRDILAQMMAFYRLSAPAAVTVNRANGAASGSRPRSSIRPNLSILASNNRGNDENQMPGLMSVSESEDDGFTLSDESDSSESDESSHDGDDEEYSSLPHELPNVVASNYLATFQSDSSESDSSDREDTNDSSNAIVINPPDATGNPSRLQSTGHEVDQEYLPMPGLMSVSESSDDGLFSDDSDSSEDDEQGDDEDEPDQEPLRRNLPYNREPWIVPGSFMHQMLSQGWAPGSQPNPAVMRETGSFFSRGVGPIEHTNGSWREERMKKLLGSLEVLDEPLVNRFCEVGGGGGEHNDECMICWESLRAKAEEASGDKPNAAAALPCLHVFHSKCLEPWFERLFTTCPVCRFDLDPHKLLGPPPVAVAPDWSRDRRPEQRQPLPGNSINARELRFSAGVGLGLETAPQIERNRRALQETENRHRNGVWEESSDDPVALISASPVVNNLLMQMDAQTEMLRAILAREGDLAFMTGDPNIPVDDDTQVRTAHHVLESLLLRSGDTPLAATAANPQFDTQDWVLPKGTVQGGIAEWLAKKEEETEREIVL